MEIILTRAEIIFILESLANYLYLPEIRIVCRLLSKKVPQDKEQEISSIVLSNGMRGM